MQKPSSNSTNKPARRAWPLALVGAAVLAGGAIAATASLTQPSAPPNAPFRIEEEFARIRFRDESLDLTRTEFRLLRLLCRRPGRVYSRSEILDAISDNPDMSLDRTIDSHVKFLRAKLKKVDPEREWIVTHRGFGYALAEG